MDEHRDPAYREPPRSIAAGNDRGRLQLLLAVVIGALLIQVIRPWGDGTSGHAAPIIASAAAVTLPSSTPDTIPGARSVEPDQGNASGASRLRMTCGSTDSWRATNMQVWPDRAIPVRSWIAIEPVNTDDPLDAAIPFVPVAADEVTAIGFCAPLDEALRPPVTIRASLWRLDGGDAAPLALIPADPTDRDTLRGLWLPPTGVAVVRGGDLAEAWPPGRYVIELATPGGAYVRQLGIEILDLAGQRSAGSTAPGEEPTSEPQGGGVSPGL